jgi:hypothetical protein
MYARRMYLNGVIAALWCFGDNEGTNWGWVFPLQSRSRLRSR